MGVPGDMVAATFAMLRAYQPTQTSVHTVHLLRSRHREPHSALAAKSSVRHLGRPERPYRVVAIRSTE